MSLKSLSCAVAAVVLAVLAGVVSVGAAPAGAAARADEEMSEQRAGQYYMRVYCAYDPARLRFNRVVFGADNTVSGTEIRRRLPEFKRAAGAFAPAIYKQARGLLNPPKAWPSSVARPIDAGATKLLQMHDAVRSAANAGSAAGWASNIRRASKINASLPGSTIRARLDLPPPGRGC